MFIKEFKKFWKINNFFLESVVWSFPKSIPEKFDCCTFVWIDGDKFADDNYLKYYTRKPKSCDVISFLDTNIDFIEFKVLSVEDIKNINVKVNAYDLTKKLDWSYDLLKKLNNEISFDFLNKEYELSNTNKNFIASFHLNNLSLAKDKLSSSLILSKVKRCLTWYFRNNPVPFGENFNEPIFIETKDINNRYM